MGKTAKPMQTVPRFSFGSTSVVKPLPTAPEKIIDLSEFKTAEKLKTLIAAAKAKKPTD